MKIPLPCEFGCVADCNGKKLKLEGVSWFQWSRGMEYTYFFSKNDKYHNTDFYTTFQNKQQCFFEIPDTLLQDKPIKEHEYPLKGTGSVMGVYYKDNRTYVDFIIKSNYLEHIRVQCDSKGLYIPGGDIIFPPSWDTEEKQERAILRSYKFIKGEPLVVKEPEPVQLSIFDFMGGKYIETEVISDREKSCL